MDSSPYGGCHRVLAAESRVGPANFRVHQRPSAARHQQEKRWGKLLNKKFQENVQEIILALMKVRWAASSIYYLPEVCVGSHALNLTCVVGPLLTGTLPLHQRVPLLTLLLPSSPKQFGGWIVKFHAFQTLSGDSYPRDLRTA